ncbi:MULTISPECIES: glycosyltransferase family 4 protein [Pelosinus]|uniref:Glycosyl transferase family 4 n=1 Tax=Pelosinus fermentans B4 TaxID=1149862 RepID=I8RAK3_9FIRM|nr:MULTISPECIES: MraY family glycosyltransferase [Pelosinus]EIW15938.1 glycosyl transferase family 4 [Pelosinus fermentans B4]EIW27356.1 Glycosyl transferase, family 4, conserved region-containing protein [Pelosinus fermentans A11]OAM92687.1 glycosyl transferase family 4 [Pelosinus fermentans DSM 17108]SDQ53677.1 UDP-GlcNAc:undecaprenyl-phosphate GlcNAc-1-phosphate transferase [Pelosinus fermentans]
MQTYIVAFTIALAVAYFATPRVKDFAIKVGALDAPDDRKVHTKPIPRMGGLAIYAAFVLAVLASMYVSREVMGLLVGGTVILIVGIIDDLKPLPARVKLLGQIIAAAVLVMFDIKIEWLTNPFGEMIYVEYLAIPLTILWVVGLTNTVNLIDGLDGLAAGVSTIASVTILLVALQQNFWTVAVLTAALAGSALGFLQHNFNPAKIFMGDTGSMFLGYMLAAISILGTVKSAATIALIVPIVALGLPILDTAFAIIRRYMSGRPIFKPDKGHLHHRLLEMGLTQKQAVLLMYVMSGCLGLSAIALTEVNKSFGAFIIVALLGIAFVGAKKIGVLKATKSIESH